MRMLQMWSAVVLLGMCVQSALAVSPVNTTLIGHKAIKGYDCVAYFTEGKPVKGEKQFAYDWNGATWLFSSAVNRDKFKKEPDRFAPQYGGYCAWAVAHNDTADIDPEAWKIVDGKLYLNYSSSIQTKWAADIAGNIQKADANWLKLVGK